MPVWISIQMIMSVWMSGKLCVGLYIYICANVVVCLDNGPDISLSVSLSGCQGVCFDVCLSIWMSFSLSVWMTVTLDVWMTVWMDGYLDALCLDVSYN